MSDTDLPRPSATRVTLCSGRRRIAKAPARSGDTVFLALDDALLVLTGTPPAGDGAAAILRWRDAVGASASGVQLAPAVSEALALPHADADDNPAGLTRWDGDTWLVVHDSPHPARLTAETEAYHADIWHLTG